MEKENIENLVEEGNNTDNEVINSFVDLPPVATVNPEDLSEEAIDTEEDNTVETVEESNEEQVVPETVEENSADNEVINSFVDLPPVATVNPEDSSEETIDEEENTVEPVVESNEEQVVPETVEENSADNEVINSFVDLPPVAPVSYEDSVEEAIDTKEDNTVEPVESSNEETINETVGEEVNVNKEVLEHPDAKITLKTEEDEVIDKKELEELQAVKLSDNSSLKFVLILGLILLIFIFLMPIISEYI